MTTQPLIRKSQLREATKADRAAPQHGFRGAATIEAHAEGLARLMQCVNAYPRRRLLRDRAIYALKAMRDRWNS